MEMINVENIIVHAWVIMLAADPETYDTLTRYPY